MCEEGFVARCRGLPWMATPEDIVNFFDDCEVYDGVNGVHLVLTRDSRSSGDAFVEFPTEKDLQRGLQKHRQHLGSRYVEVFRSNIAEMGCHVGVDPNNVVDAVVKLRGLPYECSKEEVAQFFTGLPIVRNGIMLRMDHLGRCSGDAFVQFASTSIAEKALGKHKERIGHRYIEVFKSSLAERCAEVENPSESNSRPPSMGPGSRPGPYSRNDRFSGPPMNMGSMGGQFGQFGGSGRGGRNVKGFYDEEFDDYNNVGYNNMFLNAVATVLRAGVDGRGGGGGMRGRGIQRNMIDEPGHDAGPEGHYVSKTGHSVHMRGMPFQATEKDVYEFFKPVQPIRVTFQFWSGGRSTGKANVDFASHQDALEAMRKHRCNMQHRYVELFLNSTPGARKNDGPGGGYRGDFPNKMGGGFNYGGNGDGGYGMNGMGGGGGNHGPQYGGGSYGDGEYGGGMNNYMDGGGFNSMGNSGYSTC